MQNEKSIPVHPKHHSKSMLGFLVALSAFGCFAFLNYQTKDNGNEIWDTVSLIGMFSSFAAFIAAFFIRTRFASCPECKRKMKNTVSMTVDDSEWEVFECIQCDKRWRIPGVSID